MSPTIRIDDETRRAIHELGGTFDSADDVVRRLLRESGHGTLLDDREEPGGQENDHDEDAQEAGDAESNNLGAREAKRRFVDRLEDDPRIQNVEPIDGERSAWRIDASERTVNVWATYSKFAGDASSTAAFYGTSWRTIERLSADRPLVLAFLGPDENTFWTVPSAELKAGSFAIPDAKDGKHWKLNAAHGDNETLLSDYRGLSALFDVDS